MSILVFRQTFITPKNVSEGYVWFHVQIFYRMKLVLQVSVQTFIIQHYAVSQLFEWKTPGLFVSLFCVMTQVTSISIFI
jgi:hypothetical protein